MFLTSSEYDRSVNTFSPEGRLFQVEYAVESIKLGSTAIGICTSEGVVLVAEKRITSPLMESTASSEKIFEVDRHIACAVSGLIPDSRTLLDRARVECQNHWFVYDEQMPVEKCAQAVSNLAIQFGDSDDDSGTAMSRPFGVSILFAGIDKKGPQLYHMDPSGTYFQYEAKAIGSGCESAEQNLQRTFHKSMTLSEATNCALAILKQVMEEKLSESNVEVVTMITMKKMSESDMELVTMTPTTSEPSNIELDTMSPTTPESSNVELDTMTPTTPESSNVELDTMTPTTSGSNMEVLTKTSKSNFHMFTSDQLTKVIANLPELRIEDSLSDPSVNISGTQRYEIPTLIVA